MAQNDSEFSIDFSDLARHLGVKEKALEAASMAGLKRSVDDLLRIATNIAPISGGQLRRSGNNRITKRRGGMGYAGFAYFSAVEESSGYGRFNYALWTHESDYNLGPGSAAAPGTDGYEVGNKYLERPLKGESDKYLGWIAQAIEGVMDD